MPQMAPMNWLMLFIFMVLTFLMFNTLNYYYKDNTPKMTKMISNKIFLKWKW